MHFQESHQAQQGQVRSLAHAGDELTEEQLCRKRPVVLVDTGHKLAVVSNKVSLIPRYTSKL